MQFHSHDDRNFDDLVGYQNGNGAIASQHDLTNGQDIADGLLDPEDFQDSEPEPRSQRSQLWAKNPLAKLGIVGGGTAIAFLLLGVVFTNIFGESNQPLIEQPPIDEPETTDEPEETAVISEEGKLKTALALSRQADQIEEIKNQPPKTLPTAEPVRAEPPPIARSVPQPAPLRPAPQVEPRPAIRPEPRRAARPAPPVVSPPTQGQPAIPEPSPVDPAAEWARLAQVGSYGQVTKVSTVSSTSPSVARERSGDRAARPPVNRQEEATILTGRRGREIAIGTTAPGILETPIVWEGKMQQQDKFIVRLEEPVVGAGGKVILPPNTLLLTEVPAISGSGLVQMSAVAAILEQDGQKTEVPLPAGGIQIRGKGGNPLLAEQYFDPGSEVASLDAGLAVLAGIGRAAELFNRSDQKVVVNDNGIVSATENADPDLVAGFLEGGADILIPQLAARNQRAIKEALKRNNFWTMEAGTPVQVFVNRPIRL